MRRSEIPKAIIVLACLECAQAIAADEPKFDFRGLSTGMSPDQAKQAARAHGGQCGNVGASTVSAQMVCVYGNEARAILSFTKKGHAARIRAIFAGDFDELEMQKYIIQSYHLVPDELAKGLYKNTTPNRFQFSRMGSNEYSLDIFNHEVALKDGPEPKARLPQL